MKSVPALLSFKPMKEEPTVSEKWVIATKPPYLVGEKCYVREERADMRGVPLAAYPGDPNPSFIYRSDVEDESFYDIRRKAYGRKWVFTTAESARRFVTILSCEPMRVEEVTEEDIIKAGLADGSCVWANGAARCNAKGNLVVNQFMDNWHKRHPGKEWAWRVEGKEEK